MKTTIFKIKKLSKSKKFLLIFLIILVVGGGLFGLKPVSVRAISIAGIGQGIADTAANTISLIKNPIGYTASVVNMGVNGAAFWVASNMSYGLAYIGGQFIALESKLLAWLIDMSSFTKMPMVQIGWKVSRDFANLFFIAILIYLAFSAILRLGNSSSIQKTLFKVIMIAVLINFSLMISGIIIDFSQMLFKYFIFGNLPADSKDSAHFSANLANALHIKDFWTPTMLEAQQSIAGTGATLLTVFTQLVFVIVFIFIVVIVLGSLVITLLVRSFWLWTLLILAPIAWFCGIVPLPLLAKYGKEWWNHFLKWTFMAPIIAFFVFLAIAMIVPANVTSLKGVNVLPSQQAQEQFGDSGIFSYQNNLKSIFNPFNIMQLFLVLGFLMAGLFAGNSLGSKAAGAAQKLISKTGKNVQGYMSRKTTQGVVGWAGGGVLAGISKGASKIPLVGGFLSKPLGVAGRYLESKGDTVKKAEEAKAAKRITQMSPDQLYDKFPTLTKNEKTAAIEGGKMSLNQLNDIFPTLDKNQKAVAIERAMKAGKMPENMKDMAMALALDHRTKGNKEFEEDLLKIDPTLRSDWQPAIKQITKLEEEKKVLESAPVKNETAIQNKEKEIDGAKVGFKKQVSETFKSSKPAEIGKAMAIVMNNEKISEGVRDVFISRAVDLDNNVVMNVTNKITELPQKENFIKSVVKMRMDRVSNADKLTDLQKWEALKKEDSGLIRGIARNSGLRELNVLENLDAEIRRTEGEKEEKEKSTPPPPPPPSSPSPTPSGWQPPPPPPPRTKEPFNPFDTGPRPETFRSQRPTKETREQTRENPPEKIL